MIPVNQLDTKQTHDYSVDEFSRQFSSESSDHKEILQKLSEAGRLVDFIKVWGGSASWKDSTGKTMLAIVAELGDIEAAKALLNKGAELNEGDKDNWTPLYRACNVTCQLGMIDLLLQSGAKVDEVNADAGSNVLHRLASYGNHHAIERILNYNNSPEFVNCLNVFASPLYFAQQKGCEKTIEVLEKNGAEVLFYKPSHPFIKAAYEGRVDQLKQLVSVQTDVLSIEDGLTQRTALDFACEQGQLDAVNFLIESGASLNRQDDRMNYHPLAWAVQGGHVEVVKTLLKYSPDLIKLSDLYGWPASHKAAHAGRVDILKLLIAAADQPHEAVHETDARGRTLLHKAYLSGNQAMINYCREDLGLVPTQDSDGRFPDEQ